MSFDLIRVHTQAFTGEEPPGKEILVNIHYIAFILPEGAGTNIEMAQGTTLWVSETMEELDKMFGVMEGLWRLRP